MSLISIIKRLKSLKLKENHFSIIVRDLNQKILMICYKLIFYIKTILKTKLNIKLKMIITALSLLNIRIQKLLNAYDC